MCSSENGSVLESKPKSDSDSDSDSDNDESPFGGWINCTGKEITLIRPNGTIIKIPASKYVANITNNIESRYDDIPLLHFNCSSVNGLPPNIERTILVYEKIGYAIRLGNVLWRGEVYSVDTSSAMPNPNGNGSGFTRLLLHKT